jgi:hypothetical protein
MAQNDDEGGWSRHSISKNKNSTRMSAVFCSILQDKQSFVPSRNRDNFA